MTATQNADGTLYVNIEWSNPPHDNDQQELIDRIDNQVFLNKIIAGDPNLGPGTKISDVTTTPALPAEGLGLGITVGIIVSGLLFLGLLVRLVVFLHRRFNPKKERRERKPEAQATVAPPDRRNRRMPPSSTVVWAAGEVLPLLRFT